MRPTHPRGSATDWWPWATSRVYWKRFTAWKASSTRSSGWITDGRDAHLIRQVLAHHHVGLVLGEAIEQRRLSFVQTIIAVPLPPSPLAFITSSMANSAARDSVANWTLIELYSVDDAVSVALDIVKQIPGVCAPASGDRIDLLAEPSAHTYPHPNASLHSWFAASGEGELRERAYLVKASGR